MFQKVKDYFSGRSWKFWLAVGGIVVTVVLMLVFGENTTWTAE
jgi:hypothetical protein